jgi:lambda family phage portal protein
MASVWGGLFKPMRLRARLARWIAPGRKGGTRMYAGARATRTTGGFGSGGNTSADAELESSLPQLRARSRQLMRDAPYAKRARTIVVNNVVGAGVGLQGQVKTTRNELNARVNDGIEAAWNDWACAEYCHTGGALHFADLERTAMSEVFTAGEVLIRLHPRAFGDSSVPLALEIIEAERLAENYASTVASAAPGNEMRMGVEVDEFQRPVAYWIRERHPGDRARGTAQTDRLVRVPADQIIHLRIVDRWPQTRGEPWLHAVLQKLNNMDQYTDSELVAARMASNYFATIESPEADPLPGEKQADGTKELNLEPGVIDQLSPGDTLHFHTPNRPNPALDPFMRYMLREFAAGANVSYESVSRDYSQSNYSSSRLALLDDRDLWRVLQQWWIRSFRERLHEVWIRQAVYAGAIPEVPLAQYALRPKAYLPVRWKLRGWSWIDPTKEVDAYKEAVKAGFITVSQVITQTGGGVDIEDVIAERKEELAMLEAAGIEVDTTVPEPGQMTASAPPADEPPAPADEPKDNPDDAAPPPARVVSIAR